MAELRKGDHPQANKKCRCKGRSWRHERQAEGVRKRMGGEYVYQCADKMWHVQVRA